MENWCNISSVSKTEKHYSQLYPFKKILSVPFLWARLLPLKNLGCAPESQVSDLRAFHYSQKQYFQNIPLKLIDYTIPLIRVYNSILKADDYGLGNS